MGGKATTLAIRITSDNQSKAGFDDAGRSVGGFADKLDKASVVAGGMHSANRHSTRPAKCNSPPAASKPYSVTWPTR
jgi:hypothetical protein